MSLVQNCFAFRYEMKEANSSDIIGSSSCGIDEYEFEIYDDQESGEDGVTEAEEENDELGGLSKLTFGTPLSQFARFNLGSSSSVLNTPVRLNGSLSKVTEEEEDVDDDDDLIGRNLAEILATDPIDEEASKYEGDAPSSSAPPSPCKPSPLRAALVQLEELDAEAEAEPKRQHWSRRTMADELIPMPKVRRTMSEVIPTPLSIPISPNKPAKEDDQVDPIPSHCSPKDAIRRISPETMASLLDGQWSDQYDKLLIIDARYPYEYVGGHIPGAHNICSLDAVERFLFSSPDQHHESHKKSLVVIHCEYSSERGPRMALHIRHLDRLINAENYPRLTFPLLYILDGGYKAFWQGHKERCDPPGQYLPMRYLPCKDALRFHQRMKPTSHYSAGFSGNKYNRTKAKSIVSGVGLRKSASLALPPTTTSTAVNDRPVFVRLAKGESMPEEFPSSDGPDIFNNHLIENCFH